MLIGSVLYLKHTRKVRHTDTKPTHAAFILLCTFDGSRNKYYGFRGDDCTTGVILNLKEIAKYCIEEMRRNTNMYLSVEDDTTRREATRCVLCNGDFTKSNDNVRDRDHITGQYRGACHSQCNINYFQTRYLPICVHNLRGYDSHIILKQAFQIVETKERIHAIPQSTEKFMTFSIVDLTFKDCFQFMAAGLGNLVEALISKGQDKFEHFHTMKQHFTDSEMELICKKGVYPYEWVDDNEKFKQEGLPPRKAFYANLRVAGRNK